MGVKSLAQACAFSPGAIKKEMQTKHPVDESPF